MSMVSSGQKLRQGSLVDIRMVWLRVPGKEGVGGWFSQEALVVFE